MYSRQSIFLFTTYHDARFYPTLPPRSIRFTHLLSERFTARGSGGRKLLTAIALRDNQGQIASYAGIRSAGFVFTGRKVHGISRFASLAGRFIGIVQTLDTKAGYFPFIGSKDGELGVVNDKTLPDGGYRAQF